LTGEFEPPAPAESTEQQQTTTSGTETGTGPGPDLLKYKTLRHLLDLVQEEIKLAFPDGEGSLGHMLRVQYIYRADGRELDVHDFPVSKQALDAYMARYMAWWQGERSARGVDIEEAFKCRTCEFVGDCEWRRGMDEERVKRARARMAAQGKGGDART
jgi:exonuclease V